MPTDEFTQVFYKGFVEGHKASVLISYPIPLDPEEQRHFQDAISELYPYCPHHDGRNMDHHPEDALKAAESFILGQYEPYGQRVADFFDGNGTTQLPIVKYEHQINFHGEKTTRQKVYVPQLTAHHERKTSLEEVLQSSDSKPSLYDFYWTQVGGPDERTSEGRFPDFLKPMFYQARDVALKPVEDIPAVEPLLPSLSQPFAISKEMNPSPLIIDPDTLGDFRDKEDDASFTVTIAGRSNRDMGAVTVCFDTEAEAQAVIDSYGTDDIHPILKAAKAVLDDVFIGPTMTKPQNTPGAEGSFDL